VSRAKSVRRFRRGKTRNLSPRFRPAGGQPLFRAFFLRLPDHNPLKRLEAFFRVISRRRRKGLRASSAARDPSVVLFAEMQNTLLLYPEQRESLLRASESLASRETPPLTKIMQRKTHPSLSLPSFVTIPRPPPRDPYLAENLSRFPVLALLSSPISLVVFVPPLSLLDTVPGRKLK